MYNLEIIIFVTAFLIIFVVFYSLSYIGQRRTVHARLNTLFNVHKTEQLSPTALAWKARFAHLGEYLTQLSVPTGTWQEFPERIRFMNAGLRSARAPIVFFASKTVLTFILPLGSLLVIAISGQHLKSAAILPIIIFSAGLGYFLPDFVLSQLIARRQKSLVTHFPDALDLITVCVEAGLSLDSAIEKVSTESARNCVPLAEELHLVTLEMRAGSNRERALRNLALRTGTHDISLLVAMLIQSERFGTSIAESLTVYAEVLRSKRSQSAEEDAAKVATKLLFPLMFCVFPAMLLVLMGPAMLNIYHTIMPSFSSSQ
jgi:tight adherence protein C